MHADEMPLGADGQEQVRHGSPHFPVQYYVDELYRFQERRVPLHWHTELEFFVASGGAVRIQVGNAALTLEDGWGIFLNANVLHSFRQQQEEARCACPNVVFSDELIAPSGSRIHEAYIRPIIWNEAIPYVVLRPDTPWQDEMLAHLHRIFALLQAYGSEGAYGAHPVLPYEGEEPKGDCFEMQVQRELSAAWQLLYCHLEEVPSIPAVRHAHQSQLRMQKMLGFIRTNYASPVTLGEIAAAANISKSEAARCFQTHMGLSPVRYLLQFRLEKACGLLRSSSRTIQEISRDCGFQSPGYFCRVFRARMGMTAMQYRAG